MSLTMMMVVKVDGVELCRVGIADSNRGCRWLCLHHISLRCILELKGLLPKTNTSLLLPCKDRPRMPLCWFRLSLKISKARVNSRPRRCSAKKSSRASLPKMSECWRLGRNSGKILDVHIEP